MSDLSKKFETARTCILKRQIGGMPSPNAINALTDIMRAANGNGSTDYNPDALKSHGIDPVVFRETQAINFAKKTLDWHDNPGKDYVSTLIARCEQCLDTKEETSLGRFLPGDLRERIEAKLKLQNPPKPATAAL